MILNAFLMICNMTTLSLCDDNFNQFTDTDLCVASKVLSYHATAPLEEANKLKVL